MSMGQESFSYEAKAQALVIHLPGELDHHNCKSLKFETDLLMEENYIKKLVFDFTDTRFMDSSGIGVLLSRYKQMSGSGGSVAIYGAGTQVMRILAIGGLTKLVKRYDTMEDAING